MKQYLHTIMRSLCIMVMLCGISTGAWAQSFSGGSGQEGDPYIISSEDDWNEFLNYNSDGNYFKLGDNIVLTTAPTEPVTINCDFNNDDNYTISVGSEDTPASVDDFSSLTALFDDSSWESIVTYYYYVTNSNWNSFISSYSSLSSNGTTSFILGESIEFSSSDLPESSLSVSESDFSMGDYTITVGSESDAVEFSSSFTHVFDNDFDSQVTYYFYVTSSTWDDFVTYYNDLSDKSKVYLVLTDNIELENEPSNPLSINDDQFIDNDHKILVSGNWTVFESDDMNTTYVEGGGYEITDNDSWKEFVTAYNNGEIDSEATVTITGEIVIESSDDLPTPEIDLGNLTFDGGSITVNLPLPSELYTIFSNSELEGNVSYNYTVTTDEWDDFVSLVPTDDTDAERIIFIISDAISLTDSSTFPSESISYSGINFDNGSITVGDSSPITFSDSYVPLFTESELESNVQYYFSLKTDNWGAFADNYSTFTANKNVTFSLEGDIVLEVPTESLDIESDYLSLDGDYTLSVGSSDDYEDLPQTFTHVFSNTDLEAQVKYYYIINNWSDFTSNFDDLSNDNVYTKLGNDATIDAGFTQITEFNGHFDGNSDDYSIIMPNCNINDLGTLFSENISEDNVTNVKYAYNNLIITDAAGLETLSNKAEEWYNNDICLNYTIDLTNGDIEFENDWTPIDNSSISINYTYDKEDKKPTHYIIFPSCSVSDIYDKSSGYILSSESIQECYQYSEITISSIEEVGYLSSELSSLCNACKIWRLTSNIDNTSEAVSSPIAIQGKFVSGEYAIFMPGFNASYYPSNLPTIFTGVTGVKYNYSDINIGGDDDLAAFITNQDAMKELSTSVTIIENVYINADNWVPIDDDFDITFTNHIYATIDSQDGLNKIAGDLSTLYNNDNYIYVEPNGKDKGDNWYDYDMTSIDWKNTTVTIQDLSSSVTILLKDNQSTNNKPFSYSEEKYLNYFYTPSYELIDVLFNNIVTVPENRGIFFTEHTDDSDHAIGTIADFAGHGTVGSPYQIYNYEMLKKFVEIVNAEDNDYTSGMYVKLASDINAQGNERFTDIDGSIMLDDFEEETIQFNNFKGSFDGNKHSIAGLTQPLFYSLDGATVKNLGIVDCNMTGTALATSANNTTVTKSYVSGVSNGLVSEDGNTVEDCYAYNPSLDESNRYTTSSTFNAETVEDISKTHNILKDNCYELGSKYSDCTLFIPEDNTFYKVSPSNDIFKWDTSDSEDQDTYIYYVNLGSGFVWIDNPIKSNASMLHNVLYRDGWLNNNTDGYTYNNVGSLRSLDYLYSWYIVDKKNCDVSTFEKNNLGMCCRVNNIYYSRNSTNTIPKTSAPDGLNTIYLPFAWNPTTDVYYSDGTPMGDDAEVYILADKLSESGGEYAFDDDALYKDYSKEKSLLFFDPANKIDATHTTKYDNFAGVSNALPTLLNIPSGESGWYIKRSGLANYFTPRGDGGSYNKDDADAAGLDNLYNNYWEDTHASSDNQKIGRSFMEIDRLGTDWANWGESDGSYSNYTYTRHYTCEDNSSNIYDCGTKKQISKTDKDRKVGIIDNGSSSDDYDIYKANEAGDIAIQGDYKQLKIYQVVTTVNGSERPLTIYQADENGDIAYDAETSDPVLQHNTTESDIIHLDDDGYPSKIYVGEQEINVLSIESDHMTGEVVSGEGYLQDKVYIKDESSYYPVVIDPVETTSSDWIILDNNGYPKKIMINYSSSPVEIDITRDGSSMTGKVLSGSNGTIKEGDDVIIEDYNSIYPLSIYVCGGHEEDATGSWSGSDFPGRAYHLGTFKTIGKGNSDITFGAGTYGDYSCYKLNSAGTGFAKVTATSTVQPFRTFFAIAPGPDPDADAGAKALSLGFCGIFDVNDIDDTPTQIDDAPVEGIKLMTPNQSRVYSLDGRYVGQYGQKKLARGMYIMNGRKFVVK